MKNATPFLLGLVCCLATNASAQGKVGKDSSHADSPAVKAQLALQLAHLLHRDMRSILGPVYDSTLSNRSDQTQNFRRITAMHLAKYAPPDTLIALSAREYERAFSESELHGLVALFTSPLGARYLSQQELLLPTFQREVALLLAPHQHELEQALLNAMHNP